MKLSYDERVAMYRARGVPALIAAVMAGEDEHHPAAAARHPSMIWDERETLWQAILNATTRAEREAAARDYVDHCERTGFKPARSDTEGAA